MADAIGCFGHMPVPVLLLLAALAGDGSAEGKPLLELVRETRAARLRGDHRAWAEWGQRTLALAPEHPDVLVSVARAHAALGHDRQAVELLRAAVNRGAGIDLPRIPELRKLAARPDLQPLVALARKNLEPVARARLFAELPDRTATSEGIAWDPRSRRLFVGNVHGEILQVGQDGKVAPFVARGTGLREMLGLKVDEERRLLWAVTGTFPDLLAGAAPKPEAGISGIAAFHLDSGARAALQWLDERPVLHGFNDLALARDGAVYVTDSAQSAVYRFRPGGKLELLARDPRLTFANGIALAADQQRLYVASVEGLSLVDVRTAKVEPLPVPADASVNSIDGLLFDGADLIGVQSSPYLSRIIRIVLAPGGRAVARVATLNSRTPAEYSQTTFAIGGGALYVVAGGPAADSALQPLAKEPRPQILRIPLTK